MIQKSSKTNQTNEATEAYQAIVQDMRDLYNGNITDQEAHEAARNLIGFCRTLLAMKTEQEQNHIHA